MRRIDAVIFDLDNTLYPELDYFEKVILQFLQKHSHLTYSRDEFKVFFDRYRPFSKDIIGDILKVFFGSEPTDKLHDYLFNCYITTDSLIRMYPDAAILLDCLSQRQNKLGLLTNGVLQAQKSKIRCLRIAHYFDHITYAREWGSKYEKPHELPFIMIAEAIGVEMDKCMFIGDNVDTDFLVPSQRGALTARLIRGPNRFRKAEHEVDLEVERLTELIEIL